MANSYVEYPNVDGATDIFSVTFPYLEKSHVVVYVDGVEDTNFTWVTTASIQTSSMPAQGSTVSIERFTPGDARLVDFENTSMLKEETLDRDSMQNFYRLQEVVEDLADTLQYIVANSGYDALNRRIVNVADPVGAQDAMTKNYMDVNYLTSINTAVTDAQTAQANAETAEANAETAETNAETAQTAAEAARDAAQAAQSAAETAETNAETAEANIDSTITDHMATANEWSKTQNFDETTLSSSSGSVAWDLSANQVCKLTLTENVTIAAPTNHKAGAQYRLTIIQDSTVRTVSWNSIFKWEGDFAPEIPSGSGERIIIFFDDDGTNLWGKAFYSEA